MGRDKYLAPSIRKLKNEISTTNCNIKYKMTKRKFTCRYVHPAKSSLSMFYSWTSYLFIMLKFHPYDSNLFQLFYKKPCHAKKCLQCLLNPLYTGRLFHCFMLNESICHFQGCWVYFVALILFLMKIAVSKQSRS